MAHLTTYPAPFVIIALDMADPEQALRFVEPFDPKQSRLKIGNELFTRAGPSIVKALVKQGFSIFLDLKFHDIPNTVVNACLAAADLGVWMMNVHTLGGCKMMEAVAESIQQYAGAKPLLIGVTLLTSLALKDTQEIGLASGIEAQVLHLATLAQRCGLDGVVCSPQEAKMLRTQCGDHFCLVTPGVRPQASPVQDQVRVMTPKEALMAGSNYLVIGRPITQAAEPLKALQALEADF